MIEPDALVMICPVLHGPCQGRSCMSWRWLDDPEKTKTPEGDCENPMVNPDAFTRAIKRAIIEANAPPE